MEYMGYYLITGLVVAIIVGTFVVPEEIKRRNCGGDYVELMLQVISLWPLLVICTICNLLGQQNEK